MDTAALPTRLWIGLRIDVRRPWCVSALTSSTPESPMSIRIVRNAVQDSASSLLLASTPGSSRLPSVVTPITIATAEEAIPWFIRALT